MAVDAQLELWTAQLHQVGGTTLLTAPLHPEIAWLDAPPVALASGLADAARRRWCEQGDVMPWVELAQPLTEVEVEELILEIEPKAKSDDPLLRLRFDVVIGRSEHAGRLAFVPALGIGAQAPAQDDLLLATAQAIHLELTRNRRLRSGAALLATQWFVRCDVRPYPVTARFLSFRELRDLHAERKQRLLPRAAQRLSFSGQRRRAYHVEAQLDEVERALRSPFAHALLLVGPAGVGKTALVEELVRRHPAVLEDTEVWSTTAARLVRTLTARGGWQEALDQVCGELREKGAWLYVRNLAELFEVGRYIGNDVSMAEYLRPRLERSELALITECTPEQEARLEARYPGYLQRLARVELTPPEPKRLERILESRLRADARDRVATRISAVREALRLLKRFAPYSGFPGRPVRFLEALALEHDPLSGPVDGKAVLTRFCADTGMPRSLVDPAEPLPEGEIRRWFLDRVFGQDAAVDAIVDVLVGVKASMARAGRPIASLLFVGPTGVGKTELAKAIAGFIFGDAGRMLRLDMSEFSTASAALRLTGGPGGEGRLTSAVRRQPFSVLLLDEIEKAHPLVFDLLLQVLGEGRLTDGQGRVADFCSTLVLMTSNLGARDAASGLSGFERRDDQRDRAKRAYGEAVRSAFRPELINRIDRIVTFSPLGPTAVERVLDRELTALARRPGLRARAAVLEVAPEARRHLAERGYDPAWGARHLQRAVRRDLAAPLAQALDATKDRHPLLVDARLREGRITPELTRIEASREEQSEEQRFERLLDEVDDARRVAWRIRAGSRMAQLVSQLAILDRQKKRQGEAFWRDGKAVATRREIRDILAQLRGAFEAIDALNVDGTLVALTRQGDQQAIRQRWSALSASAQLAYRACYTWFHRGERAVLGLYGPIARVEWLVHSYTAMADRLGFEQDNRRAWLTRTDTVLTFALGEQVPDHCHHPIGVELELRGPGAGPLFAHEAGIQAWSGTPEQRALVVVMHCGRPGYEAARPEGVHRKRATRGRWRRHHGHGMVEDRGYKETFNPRWLERDLEARLRALYHAQIVQDLVD